MLFYNFYNKYFLINAIRIWISKFLCNAQLPIFQLWWVPLATKMVFWLSWRSEVIKESAFQLALTSPLPVGIIGIYNLFYIFHYKYGNLSI